MLTRKIEACQDDPVELRVDRREGVHFIVAEGELVTGEADTRLKQEFEKLLRNGGNRVVVDFTNVSYIDSSVLGQLVHGYSLMKKQGGALKLVNPSRRVLDLLSLTRLITIFEIFPNSEDAIASWNAQAS